MINYYEVLGVDIKAEAIVIRSAYKAMIQKYHPDKAIDKKQIDEYLEKTKLINEAYNVLSNEVMRKKYNEKMSDSSYSDEEINYDSEEDDITSSINERWLKIIEYVQGLDDLYKELDKISKDLSWEFKASVVSNNKYNNYKNIAKKLKKDFLESQFGKNKDIQELGVWLLRNGEKNIAQEISYLVSELGWKAVNKKIIKKILNKNHIEYPKFVKEEKRDYLVSYFVYVIMATIVFGWIGLYTGLFLGFSIKSLKYLGYIKK